jgi:hypothetical protein
VPGVGLSSPLDAVRELLRGDVAMLLGTDGADGADGLADGRAVGGANGVADAGAGGRTQRLHVRARAGRHAAQLPDVVLVPPGSVLATVLRGGRPRRLYGLLLAAPDAGRARRLGPSVLVPTPDAAGREAVLVVSRLPGAAPFNDTALASVARVATVWTGWGVPLPAAAGTGPSP